MPRLIPRAMGQRASGCVAAIAAGVMLTFFPGFLSAEEPRPSSLKFDMPGTIPQLSSEPVVERLVNLTDHRVDPQTITIGENERISWLSYSGTNSTLVFEREIVSAMRCRSVVNFTIQDDELRSGTIHTGDVVSFCPLEPGRYRYRVVHKDQNARGKNRIEGVIVVESASQTAAN